MKKILIVLAIFGFFAFKYQPEKLPNPQKTNIIFILADGLGYGDFKVLRLNAFSNNQSWKNGCWRNIQNANG